MSSEFIVVTMMFVSNMISIEHVLIVDKEKTKANSNELFDNCHKSSTINVRRWRIVHMLMLHIELIRIRIEKKILERHETKHMTIMSIDVCMHDIHRGSSRSHSILNNDFNNVKQV
jgi:hypothetical protein